MPTGNPGQGRGAAWIFAHQDHQGEACLIWPFAKCNGYAHIIGYKGRKTYAYRFMCELVNGPAPSPMHHAAHSCGNGDKGCINPRHLSWKTVSENQFDRTRHGRKSNGCNGKLTQAQADAIRELRGRKKQSEIAAFFGISRSTVSWIHCGKLWRADRLRARPAKKRANTPNHSTSQQDQQ